MTDTKHDDGGPAFPGTRVEIDNMTGKVSALDFSKPAGMTLWDHYAAAALTGMLADSNLTGNHSEFARQSGETADAMLAERNKRWPR